MKRDRTAGPAGLGRRTLVVDTESVSSSRGPRGEGEPVAGVSRRVSTLAAAGVRLAGASTGSSEHAASGRHRVGWSQSRLSAAVSATRCRRGRVASEQPLDDEVEFFSAVGIRRDVPAGVGLVHRGTPMPEVHLVERGAVAVLGDHRGRRPILAFVLRREVCCAVPALLHEAAPWDAVAVTDASVITVPVDVFTAAVHERWVDRWTTRTLAWLAEVGACAADLDEPDPAAQVAALLLRSRGEVSADLCRRTIADLLDLDDATIRDVLGRLEFLGAVRLSDGRISVARPEILRGAVVGIHRS